MKKVLKPWGLVVHVRLILDCVFSSPEAEAQGELIVWDSSRRPCVRPSVRPHFQT